MHLCATPSIHLCLQEVNDAAKNDQIETVPPEVMKELAEMGAFGMQVCIYIIQVISVITSVALLIGSS